MNKTPFFTVVIPTYNREKLLVKAINSVLAQTFRDWELIVADDCSTDNTREVVSQIQSNNNIIFVSNEQNLGNAGARNLGSKGAGGQYVCFLDSDDQMHPNFLEEMEVMIQQKNRPGFLWCYTNVFNTKGVKLKEENTGTWKPENKKDPYVFFLKGIQFGTDHGLTVKRKVFDSVGYFDENLRTAVDTDFILRLVKEFSFAYIPKALIDTYDHAGERVRKDQTEKYRSYRILYNKHKETILKHKDLRKRWNYKLMWLAYHTKNKTDARKYLRNSLNLKNYKSLFLAGIFEIFPNNMAKELHKKISS